MDNLGWVAETRPKPRAGNPGGRGPGQAVDVYCMDNQIAPRGAKQQCGSHVRVAPGTGDGEPGAEAMRRREGPAGAGGRGAPADAGRKERRIGKDFTGQLGRLAILWGDIEGLVRTLELMKGDGLTYRAKSDGELKAEYRAEDWRPFEKASQGRAAAPDVDGAADPDAEGRPRLRAARRGDQVGKRAGRAGRDHARGRARHDLRAGRFNVETHADVSPEGRHVEPRRQGGTGGPVALTTDGLRRAGDDLAGYVYDLRLFRTVFQVKAGDEIRMQVAGGQPALNERPALSMRTCSRTRRMLWATTVGWPCDWANSVWRSRCSTRR